MEGPAGAFGGGQHGKTGDDVPVAQLYRHVGQLKVKRKGVSISMDGKGSYNDNLSIEQDLSNMLPRSIARYLPKCCLNRSRSTSSAGALTAVAVVLFDETSYILATEPGVAPCPKPVGPQHAAVGPLPYRVRVHTEQLRHLGSAQQLSSS